MPVCAICHSENPGKKFCGECGACKALCERRQPGRPPAKAYRFENQGEVRISREGERVILEPAQRRWSRAFLELSGVAPDFPYPDEPPPAEPGPDLD